MFSWTLTTHYLLWGSHDGTKVAHMYPKISRYLWPYGRLNGQIVCLKLFLLLLGNGLNDVWGDPDILEKVSQIVIKVEQSIAKFNQVFDANWAFIQEGVCFSDFMSSRGHQLSVLMNLATHRSSGAHMMAPTWHIRTPKLVYICHKLFRHEFSLNEIVYSNLWLVEAIK